MKAPRTYSNHARLRVGGHPALKTMETERPNPRYSGIDVWDPADILDAMIEGQLAAVAAVRAARPAMERAALAIEARLKGERGRLIYAGAGTSGRLAVQDGAELIPTFSWPRVAVLLLMAGGMDALLKSIEGRTGLSARTSRSCMPPIERYADRWRVALPFTLACLREAKARCSHHRHRNRDSNADGQIIDLADTGQSRSLVRLG